MKRKFINALLVCGLIVTTAFSLSSCKDYDDDIDSLQEQINSLSSLTDSEVSTVESSIASLQQTASSLSSEISSVETSLEAAIAQKASSSEVDALESEISSLTASLSQVEAAISTLEAAVDGDIAELETALAEANAAVAAAQSTADDALAAATTANETLSTIITSLATVQSNITSQLEVLESSVKEALQNAANAQADAEAALSYITTLQGLEEEDSSKIAALQAAQEIVESNLSTLTGRVDDAESQIAELWKVVNAGISSADLEAIQALIDEASADLQKKIDDITNDLDSIGDEVASVKESVLLLYGVGKQLKSLVFSPYLYWGGIEAIEVAYLNYKALGQDEVKADGNYETDAPYSLSTPVYVNVAPIVSAEYFLNPANAVIETDPSYFSYIVNHAQTRSLSASAIEIKDVERTDGVIDVTFKIQDAGLQALLANGTDEIDVAALQYTSEDTVITSDFAALYINEVTEFNINAVSSEGAVDTETPTTSDSHLATSANDAITDYENGTGTYPVLYVKYDSSINLEQWINVHKGTGDELWGGKETLAKSDFYMTYELVGWLHGDNDTSESVHSALSDMDEDGISDETLTPTPAVDGAAPITTVGRAPLVRVTLWDNNDSADKHIVAVGYIIVEITEEEVVEEQKIKTQTIELSDEYKIACGSDDINVTTKWSEIEVKLYTLVELSKANFESIYELEGMTDNGYATQYNSSKEALDAADYIGEVTLTTSDNASTQTNVIQWAVSNEEAYEAFVTNGKSEIVTYVKMVSSKNAYPDIFIELTWAPSNAPISGLTATIANSAKIAADWHENNSRTQGYYDIHFEVGNPTDPSASDDYDPLEVNATFKSGQTPYDVIYTAVNSYSSTLAAQLSTDVYTFEVTQDVPEYKTTQGNIYYPYVNSATSIGVVDDSTYPTAGTYTELATLDQTSGEVTLVQSDILKEILNSPEYGDYKTSLTFTIGLIATTCDPAGSEFITAKFESEDIDVIVVKPLYITEAKVEGMQWNDYSSLTQDLTITLHDYNGYSDTEFFKKSTGLSDIVTFYGITGVDVDYNNITDNYDGEINSYYGDKYDITANISITTDSSTGAVTFGTVTLEQLTSSRSDSFEIYLPITLTYDWGTIYATVTVYVEAASGSAKQR